MPGVHDPFDDLLHTPRIHAIALLEREWMICWLELHEGARRPRSHVHHCLEQLSIGIPGNCRAEPPKVPSAAAPIRVVEARGVAREAVTAQGEPDAIIERLLVPVHGDLETAPNEEPFVVD